MREKKKRILPSANIYQAFSSWFIVNRRCMIVSLYIVMTLSVAAWASLALAETEVGGSISANSIWDLSSSPYLTTTTVIVNKGVTLRIEPGVVVKFNTGTGLNVAGTLNIAGTESDPVFLTSNQAAPAPGDWKGISFDNQSGGSLEYCVVEYADVGVYIYQICSPRITHCTIRSNNRGIEARNWHGNHPDPVVHYCSFLGNGKNYYVSAIGGWNTKTLDATQNWWGTQNQIDIAAPYGIIPTTASLQSSISIRGYTTSWMSWDPISRTSGTMGRLYPPVPLLIAPGRFSSMQWTQPQG